MSSINRKFKGSLQFHEDNNSPTNKCENTYALGRNVLNNFIQHKFLLGKQTVIHYRFRSFPCNLLSSYTIFHVYLNCVCWSSELGPKLEIASPMDSYNNKINTKNPIYHNMYFMRNWLPIQLCYFNWMDSIMSLYISFRYF